MHPLRLLTAAAVAAATLTATATATADRAHHHHHHRSLVVAARGYAHHLARRRGWASQIGSLDRLVGYESSYDPCAVYGGRHLCSYRGDYYAGGRRYESCGVPQATPCPRAWLGRLAATWRAQDRWLVRYIGGRYGDPDAALRFHEANGWY